MTQTQGHIFHKAVCFKKMYPPPSKYPSIADHAARWSLSHEQFVPFSMFCLRLFESLFKTIPKANLGPKTEIFKKNLGILFKRDIFFHMLFGGACSVGLLGKDSCYCHYRQISNSMFRGENYW